MKLWIKVWSFGTPTPDNSQTDTDGADNGNTGSAADATVSNELDDVPKTGDTKQNN